MGRATLFRAVLHFGFVTLPAPGTGRFRPSAVPGMVTFPTGKLYKWRHGISDLCILTCVDQRPDGTSRTWSFITGTPCLVVLVCHLAQTLSIRPGVSIPTVRTDSLRSFLERVTPNTGGNLLDILRIHALSIKCIHSNQGFRSGSTHLFATSPAQTNTQRYSFRLRGAFCQHDSSY